MTEPVVYLVDGVAFNDIDRAKVYSDVLKYRKKIAVESLVPIPLYTAEQLHPRVKMPQAQFDELEISLINALFDYSELKKTIEIVPDMKWFVRSKEKYQPDMDQGISESGYLYLMQGNFYKVDYHLPTPFKDDAQQFDTKEDAEKWTNPLTEAVQLAVEDE